MLNNACVSTDSNTACSCSSRHLHVVSEHVECLQCRSVLNTTCNQDLKTLWQHVAKLNDIQRDLPMYGAIGAEERILREQVEDGSIRLLRTLMGSSKLEAQSL